MTGRHCRGFAVPSGPCGGAPFAASPAVLQTDPTVPSGGTDPGGAAIGEWTLGVFAAKGEPTFLSR